MQLTKLSEKILILSALVVTANACGKVESTNERDSIQNSIAYGGTMGSESQSSNSNIATLVTSASDLPECTEANNGRLYYLKSTKEFRLCQDAEFVDLDIRGNAAPSGAWVLDGDGTPIGAVLKIDTFISIVTSNGGAFNIFVPRGTHATAPYLDTMGYTLSPGSNCSFTTTDCTGICYQRSGVIDASLDSMEWYAPAHNAVYEKSPGVFVRATGKEAKENVILKSAWRHFDNYTGNVDTYAALTCRAITDIEQGNSFNGNAITEYSGPAYPITESFSFPENIHYPFKTPLTIGVAP